MKTARPYPLAFCLGSLALCLGLFGSSLARADEGFNLSKLNPFAKKQNGASRQISDQPQPSKGLPKFQLPQWKSKPQRNPYEPSGWQKFNAKTKDFLEKSKETLAPWSKPKRRMSQVRRGGGLYPPRSGREKKKSLFSWFHREEEAVQPQTVGEFLQQERPKF